MSGTYLHKKQQVRLQLCFCPARPGEMGVVDIAIVTTIIISVTCSKRVNYRNRLSVTHLENVNRRSKGIFG